MASELVLISKKNTNLGIKIYQYFIDFKKLEFKFKLVLILISMVEMCNRKYQKKKENLDAD